MNQSFFPVRVEPLDIKPCNQCVHFRPMPRHPYLPLPYVGPCCAHKLSEVSEVSVITGFLRVYLKTCERMRNDWNECGQEGALFELKEELKPKRKWWQLWQS